MRPAPCMPELRKLNIPAPEGSVALDLLTAFWAVVSHRWPKRNTTGGPVRNMRVCMGEIEFET